MGHYGPQQGYGYYRQGQQGSINLDSGPGRIFAQTCTQCHALPDPRQHSAQEWSGVIARMQEHMRDYAVPLPDRESVKDIESFLEQHSRDRP